MSQYGRLMSGLLLLNMESSHNVTYRDDDENQMWFPGK